MSWRRFGTTSCDVAPGEVMAEATAKENVVGVPDDDFSPAFLQSRRSACGV